MICHSVCYLFASGALPQLVELFLQNNQTGDNGLTSLSDALASGGPA